MRSPPRSAIAGGADSRTLSVAGAVTCCVIGSLALWYIIYGVVRAETERLGPFDFRMRWEEIQLFIAGVDPDLKSPPTPGPWDLGYTPWSYVIGLVLVSPLPWTFAKLWFCTVSLAALAVAWVWMYSIGRRESGSSVGGALIATSALCLFAAGECLRWGNYGIVVLGFIVGMAHFESKGRGGHAGICLAMAMVKPHLALPFAFILLVRKSWIALLTAGGLVGAMWLIAAAQLGKSPWSLLSQMASHAATWRNGYFGIADPIMQRGANAQPLLSIVGAACAVACLSVLYCLRGKPLWVLLPIPAVITTMWTYQRVHDAVVISFLVAAAGSVALRTRHPAAIVGFVLACVTVWQPTAASHGAYFPWWIPIGFRMIWCAVLLLVIFGSRLPSKSV